MTKPSTKELEAEIEKILMEYGNRLLDVKNGRENPTLGELIEKPTLALKKLIDEARQQGWDEAFTKIRAELKTNQKEKEL